MNSIYHYCTVESLKSILEHKTIRLSDISKSNDPNEIKFIYDAYLNWLIKNKANNVKNLKEIIKVQVKFNEEIKNATFLVSCFSKNKNDLHMWNCYGNKGVCIEFDREKLEDHIKLFQSETKNILFTRESFDNKFNKLIIEDVEYKSTKELNDIFSKRFPTSLSTIEERILFELAPIYKNKFFQCEEEVRIIYRFIEEKDGKFDLRNKLNYLTYDNSKERIYFKSVATRDYLHKMALDIPIDMNLIKSITIGPNCSLSVKDIFELLFLFEIKHLSDKDVKKSKKFLR